jgi:uncharacterized membrane protein YtjA (UPF0391 family)
MLFQRGYVSHGLTTANRTEGSLVKLLFFHAFSRLKQRRSAIEALSWNKSPEASFSCHRNRRTAMLYYALVFLVVALIAGVLGFGGIAGASAGIAKILFLVFIVLFLISLVSQLFRRRA